MNNYYLMYLATFEAEIGRLKKENEEVKVLKGTLIIINYMLN